MYHVSDDLQKHKWKFGRTKNAVGTQAATQLFRVLPHYHKCFYNFIETCSLCFGFLENTAMKKGKQLVDFNYQNLNSLCSRHHYVNSSC